jgi:hypothetical protein
LAATAVFPTVLNWSIECLVEYTDPDTGEVSSFNTNPSRWPYYTTTYSLNNARLVATGTITEEVWNQFADEYGYWPDSVWVLSATYTAGN